MSFKTKLLNRTNLMRTGVNRKIFFADKWNEIQSLKKVLNDSRLKNGNLF